MNKRPIKLPNKPRKHVISKNSTKSSVRFSTHVGSSGVCLRSSARGCVVDSLASITGLPLLDNLATTVATVASEVEALTAAQTVATALQLLAVTSAYFTESWPESANVQDGDKFDFVIVGGGTAGLVLANRLTEISDWSVLVVEAGGDPPIISTIPGLFQLFTHSPWDWDFYNEYENETSHSLQKQRVSLTRGKVLGGSSSIDHLLYDRGNTADYDSWEDLGNEDWSFENCLKYFKKMESLDDPEIMSGPTAEYHCTNGLLGAKDQYIDPYFRAIEDTLIDSFAEMGIKKLPELTGPDQMGSSYHNFRINKNPSTRSSTAQNYLLPAKDRENLFILKYTRGIKIIFNENNEAEGVILRKDSGDELAVYANKEVIVSSGVYNTPKILQLSGIGPEEVLTDFNITVIKDLPVGENLHDHAFAPMVITGNNSIATVLEVVLSLLQLTTFPLPLVSGSFSLTGNETVPDLQFITAEAGAISVLMFYLYFINFNYGLELSLPYLLNTLDRQIIFSLVILQHPESSGTVYIRSTDPDDAPIIRHNFLSTERDVQTLANGVRKVRELKDTTAYKDVNSRDILPPLKDCDKYSTDSDDYWHCYVKSTVSTTYHPTGTCKMAPEDQGGVVDSHLRVYGVSKLRVIDDSIIPVQPCAKTAAVINMIAEKAADIIKSDHGQTIEEFVCTRD